MLSFERVSRELAFVRKGRNLEVVEAALSTADDGSCLCLTAEDMPLDRLRIWFAAGTAARYANRRGLLVRTKTDKESRRLFVWCEKRRDPDRLGHV